MATTQALNKNNKFKFDIGHDTHANQCMLEKLFSNFFIIPKL